MKKNSKIYVAGHRGLVGSAIVRNLKAQGYTNLILKTHEELDLTRQELVESFFQQEKPEYVFFAAAKVGGIGANVKYPVEFLMDNLLIQNNILKAAFENKVEKLMFLGSSCIYPTQAPQPLKEEYLLTGLLEPTNEGYALAKIAGLKACEYYNRQYGAKFISVMPPNLYGINDNFNLQNAHIVASLIGKMHEAKLSGAPQIEVWGTGNQYRELMFVDDMAEATIYLMCTYDKPEFINIGLGKDYTVREIAETIKEVVGYTGEIWFNTEKPDGMYRKVLDVSKMQKLGWSYKTELREGIKKTYNWYLENKER